MSPEERAFPAFAAGVVAGLYKAAISDIDVFLLAVTGILLGARSGRRRGLGKALAGYVVFRRADGYVHAILDDRVRNS